MTKSELEKAGFKLAAAQPIWGCVYSSDEKNSYWLYKITEAVPKKKLK
jgi:hypothetical protein